MGSRWMEGWRDGLKRQSGSSKCSDLSRRAAVIIATIVLLAWSMYMSWVMISNSASTMQSNVQQQRPNVGTIHTVGAPAVAGGNVSGVELEQREMRAAVDGELADLRREMAGMKELLAQALGRPSSNTNAIAQHTMTAAATPAVASATTIPVIGRSLEDAASCSVSGLM